MPQIHPANRSWFFCAYIGDMTKDKFKSTELKQAAVPVFINGDDSSVEKVLTDCRVAKNALNAVFRDRPSYFKPRSVEGSEHR